MLTAILPFKNFILATTILLAATATTFAQTQIPPPPQQQPPTQKSSIAVRSEVVLVPAIVTNHSGAHVSDLTRSDFTIFENGKLQQIAFFHHIQANSKPVEQPNLPPGVFTNSLQDRSQRSAILVFDLLNSSITEQENARAELVNFLTAPAKLDEPVCLLAIDANGIQHLQDFTKNKALLLSALNAINNHRSPKDRPVTNPLEVTYRGVHGWHSRSANRNGAAMQGRTSYLEYEQEEQAGNEGGRTLLTLAALRQIGEAYSGIPGRKSLIWATGGFPFELDDASKFASYGRALMPAYENAWRTLARGNIAVYPLDVEDLVNPAFVAPNTGQPLPQHIGMNSALSRLETFAESTGGKLCDRQTSVLSCFAAAVDDSSDYYLIGFYESSANTDSGWRKLSVKVGRSGLFVRSRSGYFSNAPQGSDETRKQDIALALNSPLDFTAVRFSARLISTSAVENGKKSVGFTYLIPPAEITVDESDNNHVSLDFAALAQNADGATVESGYSQNLEGHIKPEGVTALHTKGLSFPGTIALPPGDYLIRLVLRDNLSGQVGSTTATLKVP